MWQRQRGVRADEVRKKCVAGVGVVGLAAGPFSVTNFQAIFQGRILKKGLLFSEHAPRCSRSRAERISWLARQMRSFAARQPSSWLL